MYFIKKYFTVFLFISQFAKNGVDDILTFMQLTCTINGTKIVIHIQFKYSLIAFSTTRLFSTKKQPFLSMLVHMHDFQSFPQLKISFFTLLGSYFQIQQCSQFFSCIIQFIVNVAISSSKTQKITAWVIFVFDIIKL